MSDDNLKMIRTGIKLLSFVIDNVEKLETRTNVMHLISNLIELFNERQGIGIVRLELMHLFATVSQKIPLNVALITILQGVYAVEKTARTFVLKTYMIICMLHGRGKNPHHSVF